MSEQNNWQLPSDFDVMNAENSTCDCGYAFFDTVVTLKKVPSSISPTGEEAVVPVPVFKCSSCGKINEEYYK
jgi:hypothetical protein